MRANTWAGRNKVEVRDVPDPKILNNRDAIVRITSTAICGSDLHLVDGYIPTMQDGDILGHEFMGEVIEVGSGVPADKLRIGDRVVVPFPIACGACAACAAELYSCCENTNPNAGIAAKMFGHPVAGIFGYSHLTGGFAGGQAQYARVPFADVGPLRIESDLSDEQVLFLSDILPTGYMGAEMCDIQPSDVVAVWGAGPVGQFAMDSARVLGAAKVIAIDKEPYRLQMAERAGHTPVNFDEVDVRSTLLELTGGRGPDKCIDAVGLEATHGSAHIAAYDRVKQAVRSEPIHRRLRSHDPGPHPALVTALGQAGICTQPGSTHADLWVSVNRRPSAGSPSGSGRRRGGRRSVDSADTGERAGRDRDSGRHASRSQCRPHTTLIFPEHRQTIRTALLPHGRPAR